MEDKVRVILPIKKLSAFYTIIDGLLMYAPMLKNGGIETHKDEIDWTAVEELTAEAKQLIEERLEIIGTSASDIMYAFQIVEIIGEV